MAIPKHYSLIQDHPQSFELHDSRDGRSFHVAKSAIHPSMHAEMSKMPHFDDGGEVKKDDVPEPNKNNAQQVQKGATESGWQPDKWAQNIKQGIQNFDDGVVNVQPDQGPAGQTGAMPTPPLPPGVDDQGLVQAEPNPAPQADVPPAGASASWGGQNNDAEMTPGAPAQTSVNPGADLNTIKGSGLDALQASLEGSEKQEQAAQKGISGAWSQYQSDLSNRPSIEDITSDRKAKDDKLLNQIQNGKVDPNHWWTSRSAGGKISAGLGMILGGVGAGLTGGPNMALETINRAIDRDIDAQKTNQSKNMSLYQLNREAMKDDVSAEMQTRNQMLTGVQAKVNSYLANANNAQVAAKFAPLLMNIQQQKFQNNLVQGVRQGGYSNMDPSQLVPYMVKDPSQQKDVFDEIKRAQNIKANSQKMLDTFDQATKDATVTNTLGGAYTPGSVMKLHQLMLPNFKSVDGTVRQAAMDESFHNLTPGQFDTADRTANKRAALVDWMNSETAAPIAKGNGLDLTKFPSTSTFQAKAPPIERMYNGRILLYDAQTKQPIGYK